ncbi:DUF6376 family protein [Thalassobacillus hwangdonensis]|uniref:DUF6376 family protein n=1 Tax=Thalassobacillus hwangdonensis TaxID=546108 RepID=A0ABW3L3K8_9BACI
MKKLLLLIVVVLPLAGCGILEEANSTLDYTEEMTAFINETEQFADEAPQMVEQAANDSEAAQELKTRLEEMKAEVEAVENLDAPQLAEDLHQRVEEYSAEMKDGINQGLQAIENGVIDPSFLENSELMQALQEFQQLKGTLENLGL